MTTIKKVNNFDMDLKQLMDKINHTIDQNSRLGDLIQYMGKNQMLYSRLKDENINIDETINISNTSRDYLNMLQTEKLTNCRLCYHKNEDLRCDFHKKYLKIDMPNNGPEYDEFLNTDMGVISFIELYYTFLGMDFWKTVAVFLIKDLTGFSSIKEMLSYYDYTYDENVDCVTIESMDSE